MSGRWKRSTLLLGAAALGVIVAASVAAAKTSVISGGERSLATLNIYGFGPGDDVANGRAAIATQAIGGGNDVDNPRGGFNDQAFLAQLASGNVPDVAYMSRDRVGTYAAKGALTSLANCIRTENIDTKQYRAAALREVTYKGQIYALPEFTNQITIIVNDDVAKAAGVAVNSISKDGLKAQLNSKEAVAALSYTLSLINDHGGWDKFKAFRDTFDFFGRQNPLAKDQIGAWPMESFIYNVFANNTPTEELTARYFTNRKGGPITMFSGSGWTIPKGAKDPDLACKWMKAMTAVDTWVAVARNRLNVRRAANPPQAFTGLYTANTKADLKIFQDIYQPMGKRQFDDAVKILYTAPRYAFALPPSPASAEFRQAYLDAINRALAGQQSPKAALDQAQREAQAAIDKNK